MRTLFVLSVLAAPLTAQSPSEYMLRAKIPETAVDARNRVIAALVAEGLPISDVAACDCVINTGPLQMKVGLLAAVAWARANVTILPQAGGSVVTLSMRATLLPLYSETIEPVHADTTKRQAEGSKVAARMMHRIIERLGGVVPDSPP